MIISDVKIRLLKNKQNGLKAVASIIIDDSFIVHDIKIIEGNEGYFIAMPSRKTAEGEYKDVAHPLNSAARQMICDRIFEEFEKSENVEKTGGF